jgi:putative transposase
MTVERMCQLGGISRSGFYRMGSKSGGVKGVDRDVELRDAIQRIALEFPSYGRPRITAALRRQGWRVNPKRVYRILREDNLLCLRKRKFVVTTDSGHGLRIYANLARERVPNGIDQLWVADIT